MAEAATIEQNLLAEIATQKAALDNVEPQLRAARLRAMGRFSELGLPTRNDEAWRWTDLQPLRAAPYGAAAQPALFTDSQGAFADVDAYRLLFVGGVFQGAPSAPLPQGVVIGSLRRALQDEPALIEQLVRSGEGSFTALNLALLNDGAFIRIAAGVRLDKPLHVIYSNTDANQVRNLIMLGSGADATLLESHHGPDDAGYFTNHVSDVILDSGARLAHYRDQADGASALHFYYLNARLASLSNYEGFTLTRGARLSRNESHVEITGRGVECNLNGAYMLGDRQLADTTTVIDHASPGSQSRQTFRGVLNDQSRGVFQGRIQVRKIAQQTDAQLQIKAMLLSARAEQYSKPELEILADDVKCAHGASIGQLDETALFYLRSRGVPLAQARAMLIGAFLDDAVAQIKSAAVQQGIRAVIENRLLGTNGAAA